MNNKKNKFYFDEDKQHLFYLFGRPNCGKSYYAGYLMKQYKKQFSNSKLVYIGPHTFINPIERYDKETKKKVKDFIYTLSDDSILKHINQKDIYCYPMHIFFKVPLDVQRLKLAKHKTLIIFDDIDAYPPKKRHVINLVKDQILKQGRAHNKKQENNIDCIITGHTSLDYNNTKPIMENCNYLIFFNGTPRKQIYETLKKFMNDEEIENIIYNLNKNNDEFNNIIIHLNYPMYYQINNKKYNIK